MKTCFGKGAVRFARACHRVPKMHISPPVSRSQAPPITTEGHADPMLVAPGKGVQELTVSSVPDIHISGISRRELSAVGAKRGGICGPIWANGVARASKHLLAGGQVPDLQLLIRA